MEQYRDNNRIYSNIFIKNKNILTKYSSLNGYIWKALCSKPLDFICKPKTFRSYEKGFKYLDTTYYSIVEFKLLDGYKTLYSDTYTNDMTDSQILKLLYKNMLMLKKMHECGVIHSDICSKNIMINKNYDIKIIDFDNSVVDDFCSIDNNFNNFSNSLSRIKELSIEQDKKDLMKMYLYRVIYGSFSGECVENIDNDYKQVMMELINTIRSNGTDIDRDYYFLDVIQDLIINLERLECNSKNRSFQLIKK